MRLNFHWVQTNYKQADRRGFEFIGECCKSAFEETESQSGSRRP